MRIVECGFFCGTLTRRHVGHGTALDGEIAAPLGHGDGKGNLFARFYLVNCRGSEASLATFTFPRRTTSIPTLIPTFSAGPPFFHIGHEQAVGGGKAKALRQIRGQFL